MTSIEPPQEPGSSAATEGNGAAQAGYFFIPTNPPEWSDDDCLTDFEKELLIAMTEPLSQFRVGDVVWKPKGYPFPGVVVAAFQNRAREWRYVVESDVAPGMLHIFSGKQLRLDTDDDV